MDQADLAVLTLLASLDEHDGALSLDELEKGLAGLVGDSIVDCSCPDCTSPPSYPPGMSGLPGELDGMETVDARGVVHALSDFGIAVLRGDVVELTPLGRWLTDVLFRQSAPASGTDAATLVRAVAGLPDTIAVLMSPPVVVSARPCHSRARTDRCRRVHFRSAASHRPYPGPRVWPGRGTRMARTGRHGRFGAYALAWLAEYECTEPADTDMAWITVDILEAILDTAPADLPLELLTGLLQAQVGAEIAEALPLLAGCGHPAGDAADRPPGAHRLAG